MRAMKQREARRDAGPGRGGAITLRGLDAALLRRIDEMARAQGLSRSRAALRLLQSGAGVLPDGRRREIGHSLDRFIGTWTEAEEQELRRGTAGFRKVDRELWK